MIEFQIFARMASMVIRFGNVWLFYRYVGLIYTNRLSNTGCHGEIVKLCQAWAFQSDISQLWV